MIKNMGIVFFNNNQILYKLLLFLNNCEQIGPNEDRINKSAHVITIAKPLEIKFRFSKINE